MVTARDVQAAERAVREACIKLVQAGDAASQGKGIVAHRRVHRDTPAYFREAENEYLDALYYYRAVVAAHQLNEADKWGRSVS